VVLLENEWTLNPYLDGEYELDHELFRQGLEQLPRDVKYIWYPGLLGSGERLERYVAVIEVVADTLGAQFTCLSIAGPAEAFTTIHWSEDARELLRSLSPGEPTIPLLYFYGPDTYWWEDEQIHEALGLSRSLWGEGATVLIYPGFTRWPDAAQSIADLLLGPEG
jgi:hypothetical protein